MGLVREYEVVRFIRPLTLFGCGVLVEVRSGDVVFTGYLQSGDNEFAESFETISARYPPGLILPRVAYLTQQSANHTVVAGATVERRQLDVSTSRAESAAHDVRIVGVIAAFDAKQERVVIDCGIPVGADWESERNAPNHGAWVTAVGDLWLVKPDLYFA